MHRRHNRGEGRRKGVEQDHHDQDQPDMIGLPDRPDRALDQFALRGGAWTTREQIPHAAAIIGASRQNVHGECDQQRAANEEQRKMNWHQRPAAEKAATSACVGLCITCRRSRKATVAPRKR